jgi:hypothetical protein
MDVSRDSEAHWPRHLFAILCVLDAEGDGLDDTRDGEQGAIDLERRELLAAAVRTLRKHPTESRASAPVDELLDPTGEDDVAVLVQAPAVARSEEAILGKGLLVRLVVVLCARRQAEHAESKDRVDARGSPE